MDFIIENKLFSVELLRILPYFFLANKYVRF